MTAYCHHCAVGMTRILKVSDRWRSSVGVGVGVCHQCTCFVCLRHGQREDYRSEFWCVLCDLSLLDKSILVETGIAVDPDIVIMLSGSDEARVFGGLADFRLRRPRYGLEFYRRVDVLVEQPNLIPNIERFALHLGSVDREAVELLALRMLCFAALANEPEPLR